MHNINICMFHCAFGTKCAVWTQGSQSHFPWSCLCLFANTGLHFPSSASVPSSLCHIPSSIVTHTPTQRSQDLYELHNLHDLSRPCFSKCCHALLDKESPAHAKLQPTLFVKLLKSCFFVCQHGVRNLNIVFINQ